MRLKSHFAATKSLIFRLIITTIRSGSATSVVALTALSLFLGDEEANYCVGVAGTLGRIYTLTMLANLNARRVIRGVGQSDDAVPSTGSEHMNRHSAGAERFNLPGIHVIRSVRMEDDVSNLMGMSTLLHPHHYFPSKTRKWIRHPSWRATMVLRSPSTKGTGRRLSFEMLPHETLS